MNKFLACVTGVAMTLVNIPGAYAQSSTAGDEASDLKLEEIVVTAERVAKDLQKVSQVIHEESGAELQKEGKRRVDEILQGLPGIQLQNTQLSSDVYMRGVSSNVNVTIDGVVVNGAAAGGGTPAFVRATMLDVDQVGVAYGVQNGAGTNSLTGSVGFVTNKPVFEYQGSGSVTLGNYNMRTMEGMINVPVTDNQAVRMAFSTDRRDGYYKSGMYDSDTRQFRVRYRWKPSDNLDITASAQDSITSGNGVSTFTLLYTGHWIDYTGQTLNWTNPYTGVASTWTQAQIKQMGYVTAGNATVSPTSVGVDSSGNFYNAATTGAGANQYLYSAGACSPSTQTNSATGNTAIYQGLAGQSYATVLAGLGPVITTMDCPYRALAIRDGVNYDQRSNPWDDGFQSSQWSNWPVRNSDQRTANVQVDWQTSYGKWSFQPSYVYSLNNSVEQQRGVSFAMNGFVPTKTWGLDAQLVSNPDAKLNWVAGFNATYSPPTTRGVTAQTVNMPQPGMSPATGTNTGWGTVSTTAAATGTTCYTVFPGATSTVAGTPNSSECIGQTYSQTGTSFNKGVSFQVSYALLDDLRLNGSARHDWYAQQLLGGVSVLGTATTLVDGNGQNYLWYLPVTTVAAASTSNRNAAYVVPVRMNLSKADLDAMVDAVHTWRKSNTNSFTLNAEYDLLPNAMLYTKLATGTQAAAAGPTSGGTVSVTLPNAIDPSTGTNLVTTVAKPAPSVKGEETRQVSLGLKSRWFDNTLQFNVEGFYNKYHNRALSLMLGTVFNWSNSATFTQTSATCTANASNPIMVKFGSATDASDSCFAANAANFSGDMLSKGVDIDMSYVPTPDDRIDLQAEYLRMTFNGMPNIGTMTADRLLALSSSGSNATVAQFFADSFNNFLGNVDGKTLQQAPRWSVTAGYQHQFALPGGSRLTPKIMGYYKSAYFFTTPATVNSQTVVIANWAMDTGHEGSTPYVQKAYNLWDAYLNWVPKTGNWSVNAYVKNIQNKAIKQNATSLTGVNTGTVNAVTGVPSDDYNYTVTGGYVGLNPPRTIGLTLQANF